MKQRLKVWLVTACVVTSNGVYSSNSVSNLTVVVCTLGDTLSVWFDI